MITGDARDTAVAIARDVNILPPATLGHQIKAYEGREFFRKPDDEQLQLLKSPGNMVFCRAEPADKQKLIKMLQSLGEISAMTGNFKVLFPFVHASDFRSLNDQVTVSTVSANDPTPNRLSIPSQLHLLCQTHRHSNRQTLALQWV